MKIAARISSFILPPSSFRPAFILTIMSVLPIVNYGDAVLRKLTNPVGDIDDALQKLIDDMVDTMYAAPGVGLAANQVGISKRLAVIDLTVGKKPGNLHIFVNPEIMEMEGQIMEEEGCLSIP